MRVALTGASGIVGRFVAARLLAEGVDVRALARPASDTRGLEGCQWARGDMADESALATLLRGADALVHCAFSHAPGRYRGGEGADRRAFWRSNLMAGIALLEQARLAGAGRVVLLSSRAVFGADTPAAYSVDDDSRPVPDTFYGALKLALEAHASAFSATDGLCCAALRPTGVYGIVHPLERSKWVRLGAGLAAERPIAASPSRHRSAWPRRGGSGVAAAERTERTGKRPRLQLRRPRRGQPRRDGGIGQAHGHRRRLAAAGEQRAPASHAFAGAAGARLATRRQSASGGDARRACRGDPHTPMKR